MKGPSLNVGTELASDLQMDIQHLCQKCEKSLNGPDQKKVMLAVKLFGLKKGYTLWKCAQMIFGPKKRRVSWESEEWQQLLSIKKAKSKVGH
jgi:uncharacterized protein with PIN domain